MAPHASSEFRPLDGVARVHPAPASARHARHAVASGTLLRKRPPTFHTWAPALAGNADSALQKARGQSGFLQLLGLISGVRRGGKGNLLGNNLNVLTKRAPRPCAPPPSINKHL